MFDSIGFQTLVFFVAALGAIYVAVGPLRSLALFRGAVRTHRGLAAASVMVALLGAIVVVRIAQSPVMCPDGFSDPTAARIRTDAGKGGISLNCTDADGVNRDGSIFAAVFAWVGAATLLFAGGMQVARAAGARPVAPPAPTAPPSGPPTDKRDRRRARKARR